MIRHWSERSTDIELFFEPFATVSNYGIAYIEPPTMPGRQRRVVIPMDNEPEEQCRHDYARGMLDDHQGVLWLVLVCRRCQHVAPGPTT